MCFSPEADVLAGLAVGAVAVDALRHVRAPAQWPVAVLPAVFAAHTLVESLVWWGLEGQVSPAVGSAAQWVYLAIAFGVLPILVPVAVGALEPPGHRRAMGVLVAVGTVVATVLMFAVVRGPIVATIQGHHIDYELDLWHGGIMTALYVVASCGSLLISSHRHVRWFGLVNLAAVVLLAWLSASGFISFWCLWAAVTSVAIAVHLRQTPLLPTTRARTGSMV